MTRTFVVGCRCWRCRMHGRHRVGYRFIVRRATRKVRRKSRALIREGKFDDVAKVSFGRPG